MISICVVTELFCELYETQNTHFFFLRFISRIIHRVRTIGGGMGGPDKSALACMGGRGGLTASVRNCFFAGSLQSRNKLKKVRFSGSQNYSFLSPPYNEKAQTRSQGYSWCFDLTFSHSFAQ